MIENAGEVANCMLVFGAAIATQICVESPVVIAGELRGSDVDPTAFTAPEPIREPGTVTVTFAAPAINDPVAPLATPTVRPTPIGPVVGDG